MADNKTEGHKVRGKYSHAKADARRDKRRREAEARQRIYDKLTLEEKLALVKSRGGSKRELARLEKIQAERTAKKAASKKAAAAVPTTAAAK